MDDPVARNGLPPGARFGTGAQQYLPEKEVEIEQIAGEVVRSRFVAFNSNPRLARRLFRE